MNAEDRSAGSGAKSANCVTWKSEPFCYEPFVRLGEVIRSEGLPEEILERALAENPWFTRSWTRSAVETIAETMLTQERLSEWLCRYHLIDNKVFASKRIGIVMAGNIPLVGWFDLMTSLLCGHTCYVKYSSKDNVLMQWMVAQLRRVAGPVPVFPLTDQTLVDGVIATGSNNANRYFESRFKGIPAVFRGSRTSVAVLTTAQSDRQLLDLWQDLFQYFGLGCRNVTRLFVPAGYDFSRLVALYSTAKHSQNEGVETDLKRDMASISHAKYRNCYRYNKAFHTLKSEPFIDGNYFTLRESATEALPLLSEIFYTYYQNIEQVKQWIDANDDNLQCIVSECVAHPRAVNFGQAQRPQLWDYPDGVDLVKFLLSV